MLRVELVEELDEKPLAAAVLELGANGDIDLAERACLPAPAPPPDPRPTRSIPCAWRESYSKRTK